MYVGVRVLCAVAKHESGYEAWIHAVSMCSTEVTYTRSAYTPFLRLDAQPACLHQM